MSNELNSNMIPSIKESYINKRIASLNSKSEKLKESEDLKMSKTMKLVLNENTNEEEQLYKKLKKEYFNKTLENKVTDTENSWKIEEKEIKNILLKAENEYGIEEEVIKEVIKMLYQIDLLTVKYLSCVINICNASCVRDIKQYKKAKESIECLVTLRLEFTRFG